MAKVTSLRARNVMKTKFDKKKIPIALGIIITFIITISLVSKMKSDTLSAIEDVRDGYVKIDTLNGVEFCVNSNVLNKATAVTQISNKVNFMTNLYYVYKDTDRYLLFNMNGLVVIAEKGTHFNFGSATAPQEAVKKGRLCGIGFDVAPGGLNFKSSDNKYFCEVSAEVTITNTLYNDFYGYLCVVTQNNEEWAIFAGVTGNLNFINEDTREQLEYMASSIRTTVSYTAEKNPFYAIDIDTYNKEDVTFLQPNKNESDKTNIGMDMNNQEVLIKEVGKAYTSNIYSLLSIGDKGVLNAINQISTQFDEIIIDITDIKIENEAESYIETLMGDDYIPPAEGCRYHMITYDLYSITDTELPYVNIKLRGLDGNNLVYRGIKYSKKTCDAFDNVKNMGKKNEGYICYYEIPNGCFEYVLECGDATISIDEIISAYYHIKTKVNANNAQDVQEETMQKLTEVITDSPSETPDPKDITTESGDIIEVQ